MVLGVVVSGLVHTGKMAARPVVNGATVGLGGPVLSTVEDGASIGLSLIAILALATARTRRRPLRRRERAYAPG